MPHRPSAHFIAETWVFYAAIFLFLNPLFVHARWELKLSYLDIILKFLQLHRGEGYILYLNRKIWGVYILEKPIKDIAAKALSSN